MQTALESIKPRREEVDKESKLYTILEFFQHDGMLQMKHFDLSTHHDRVGMTKVIVWAIHNEIEIRVRKGKRDH